jgi:hypothetical protein
MATKLYTTQRPGGINETCLGVATKIHCRGQSHRI